MATAAVNALIAAWNSVTQPPAGVTGTGLTAGMTTQQKIDAVDGWTVAVAGHLPALLTPSQILNAIVFADLATLTQLQVLQLTLLLSGTTVDVTSGTIIRAAIQALFAGKTTTLANLAALVAPFDNPTQPWWQSVGFQSPPLLGDAIAAGLI